MFFIQNYYCDEEIERKYLIEHEVERCQWGLDDAISVAANRKE
jgi:hypothetical protein